MVTLANFAAATCIGCFGGLYFLAFSKTSRTSHTNAAASWYFIESRVSAIVLSEHREKKGKRGWGINRSAHARQTMIENIRRLSITCRRGHAHRPSIR